VRLLTKVSGLAVLCVLLAACGTGDREREASQVAAEFLGATAGGDTTKACALLTPRTRDDLIGSEGSSCTESLRVDQITGGTVESVRVYSDWAQVNTEADTLFLTELDTGWRVAAAGCTSRGESLPYRCTVGD
jgi:hypothetical protein